MSSPLMRTSRLLRFSDLRQRGIVRNWPTLRRLVERQGFPPGIRLGAQARAWPEAEIDAWLETRRISPPGGSRKDSNSGAYQKLSFAPVASEYRSPGFLSKESRKLEDGSTRRMSFGSRSESAAASGLISRTSVSPSMAASSCR